MGVFAVMRISHFFVVAAAFIAIATAEYTANEWEEKSFAQFEEFLESSASEAAKVSASTSTTKHKKHKDLKIFCKNKYKGYCNDDAFKKLVNGHYVHLKDPAAVDFRAKHRVDAQCKDIAFKDLCGDEEEELMGEDVTDSSGHRKLTKEERIKLCKKRYPGYVGDPAFEQFRLSGKKDQLKDPRGPDWVVLCKHHKTAVDLSIAGAQPVPQSTQGLCKHGKAVAEEIAKDHQCKDVKFYHDMPVALQVKLKVALRKHLSKKEKKEKKKEAKKKAKEKKEKKDCKNNKDFDFSTNHPNHPTGGDPAMPKHSGCKGQAGGDNDAAFDKGSNMELTGTKVQMRHHHHKKDSAWCKKKYPGFCDDPAFKVLVNGKYKWVKDPAGVVFGGHRLNAACKDIAFICAGHEETVLLNGAEIPRTDTVSPLYDQETELFESLVDN